MNIFTLLTLAMLLIIALMRKHVSVGLCMLAGGIFLWVFRSADPMLLGTSLLDMLQKPRTYDLLISLYLVMCLEIQLRTSGTLAGMVQALQKMFSSAKIILAIMPGFLGLLPSLGGARFSAPIVDEASKEFEITPEDKAAINFWFRHPFEFSNPIIPGMIMACSISQIPYADFVVHTAWVSVLCVTVGWVMLITPLKKKTSGQEVYKPIKLARRKGEPEHIDGTVADVILAIAPIVTTFLMVVFLGLNASIAMLLSTFALFMVLFSFKRQVSIQDTLIGAIDKKMLLNITCILYFIQLLENTGVLSEVVVAFQSAPLPLPVMIAGISIIVGILTGMSQAHVAIVMPLAAALKTGDMTLVTVAMVFGVAGQMLTPTHVCFPVTTDYFKADFFTVLKKMALLEIVVLAIFSAYTYLIM